MYCSLRLLSKCLPVRAQNVSFSGIWYLNCFSPLEISKDSCGLPLIERSVFWFLAPVHVSSSKTLNLSSVCVIGVSLQCFKCRNAEKKTHQESVSAWLNAVCNVKCSEWSVRLQVRLLYMCSPFFPFSICTFIKQQQAHTLKKWKVERVFSAGICSRPHTTQPSKDAAIINSALVMYVTPLDLLCKRIRCMYTQIRV